MSICYDGSRLGSALVHSWSQPARSCHLLKLPARLDAIELAHHGKKFLADVKRREMELDAAVDIAGVAKLLWLNHRFKLRVDSYIVVDPVFLDVVDQENKAQLQPLNA
ncbi:hypothetical protein RJ641_033267 [Dillenia turbinata]|uniref:Uncharacterized protein n=1 Tax=Dillenia turbinata TaxID=194707 RepID=A0AAN8VZB1_9MAGN